MRLLFRNHLKNAFDALNTNKGRSFLTVIGISIGVASIIIIMSISGGVKQLIADQIESVGGNVLVIRPDTNRRSNDKNVFSHLTTTQTYAGSSLTGQDVATVRDIASVKAAAPIAIVESSIKADNDLAAVPILASNTDLDKIMQLPMRDGQFFDDTLATKAIVVGFRLALQLFGDPQIIGKYVTIKGEQFMVIGLLADINSPINYNNIDLDYAAIINIRDLPDIVDTFQIQQINVLTTNEESLQPTADEITTKLLVNHKSEPDFVVAHGDQISHPTEELFDIVTSMLTIVAGVSLIVGGIGVMNIMLVSVAERTHEIGIKKAVGASNYHVLMQFLFEALILSFFGGLLGFVFGYAFAFGISLFTPFSPVINSDIVYITLTTSVSIGCIFGIYPAISAARKNPIDSLKHYR